MTWMLHRHLLYALSLSLADAGNEEELTDDEGLEKIFDFPDFINCINFVFILHSATVARSLSLSALVFLH